MTKCLNLSIIKYMYMCVTISYKKAFYLLDAVLDLLQCKNGYMNSSLIHVHVQSLWLHFKAINCNHQTIYRLCLSLKIFILNDIYLYLWRRTKVGSTYSPNTRMNRVFKDTTQKTCSCNKGEWYTCRLVGLVTIYTTHTNSFFVDRTLTHQEHQGSI